MKIERYHIDQEPDGLRVSMRQGIRGIIFSLFGLGLAAATHLLATHATWMVAFCLAFSAFGLFAAAHREEFLFTSSDLTYSSTFGGTKIITRESISGFRVHEPGEEQQILRWKVELTGRDDKLPCFEFDSKKLARHFAETVARPWQLPVKSE